MRARLLFAGALTLLLIAGAFAGPSFAHRDRPHAASHASKKPPHATTGTTTRGPAPREARPYDDAPIAPSQSTDATETPAVAVALGLAALGIYGLVAYTAEMRSRELAIREALGASRAQVAGLMLKGAFVQALAGAVAGAMLSIIAIDYLNGFQLRLKATGGATIMAFAVISLTVLLSSIGPLTRT